tara:strand:+ start:16569 stop:20216 length:3648 start_codon:yes stop_codon:yes gene_type:complete
MLDAKTGREVWIPDDDVEDSWKSGRYVFEKDSPVNVSIGGKYEIISEADLQDVFARGGHYDTAQQRSLRSSKKYFEDQGFKAAAIGLARGPLGKGADLLLDSLGVIDKRRIDKIMDANPVAGLLGEVVGGVGTAVLSGGTGALAKVASITPAGIAARGGAALAGKVGAATLPSRLMSGMSTVNRGRIGTAAGMAGNPLAQSRLGRAATGAIEAAADVALYETLELIPEEMLGDPRSFAERFVSDVGVGAIFGAGLGGVLGGVLPGGINNQAVSLIADIQYNSLLKKTNKIFSTAEVMAAGGEGAFEVKDRLLRSLAGDDGGRFANSLAGGKGTYDDIIEDAAEATRDEAQTMLDLGVVTRATASPKTKGYPWGRMMEESPDARINTNPDEVYNSAINQTDEMLAGLRRIEGSLTAEVDKRGIGPLIAQWEQVQEKIKRQFKEDLGVGDDVKMDWDPELEAYVISRESTEYTEALRGKKKFRKLSDMDEEQQQLAHLIMEDVGSLRSREIALSNQMEEMKRFDSDESLSGVQALKEAEERLAQAMKGRPEGVVERRRWNKKVRDPLEQSIEDLKVSIKSAEEEGLTARLALGRELRETENNLRSKMREGEKLGLDIEGEVASKTGQALNLEDLSKGDLLASVPEHIESIKGIRGNLSASMPKIYTLLDQAKGTLQSSAFRNLQKLDLVDQINVPEAGKQSALADLAVKLRSGLEDATIWGTKAADAQKEINDAYTLLIGNTVDFNRSFSFRQAVDKSDASEESIVSQQRKKSVADINKARSAVKEVARDYLRKEGNASITRFKANRTAIRKFIGAIENTYGEMFISKEFKELKKLFYEQSEKTEAAWENLFQVTTGRKMLKDIADSGEAVAPNRVLQTLAHQIGWRSGGAVGASVGAAFGGPMGGVLGGAVGGAGGALYGRMNAAMRSPAERLIKLTHLQARSIKAKKKLTKNVDKAVKSLLKNKDGTFRVLGTKMERLTWAATWNRLLSRDGDNWASNDERKISEEAILGLFGWKTDPGTLQDKILVATSMMSGSAPEVTVAIQEKLTQICMYAAGNVDPSITVNQDPFTGEQTVSGPDFAFGKFNDMMMSLEMGLPFITDNLINGTLTPSMIHAWKINFPEQYSGFCSELITKIAPQGKQMSYAARGSITALFDVPLEPSYSPGTMNVLQGTWELRDAERDDRGRGGTIRPSALKNQVRAMETQTDRHQAPSLD